MTEPDKLLHTRTEAEEKQDRKVHAAVEKFWALIFASMALGGVIKVIQNAVYFHDDSVTDMIAFGVLSAIGGLCLAWSLISYRRNGNSFEPAQTTHKEQGMNNLGISGVSDTNDTSNNSSITS